jgi:hypothetical protein
LYVFEILLPKHTHGAMLMLLLSLSADAFSPLISAGMDSAIAAMIVLRSLMASRG